MKLHEIKESTNWTPEKIKTAIVAHFMQNANQDLIYDISEDAPDNKIEEIIDQIQPVFRKMKMATGDDDTDDEMLFNAALAVYHKFFKE